ncbi:MAG TPA: proprotein convertase P-domain-containing protein, partial [Bacteroidales bacterium]|nr:proprotein convertase P-domain-containing protein [Bacteroidales bacterium]
ATPPLPNACSGGQYDVYVGNDPQATIIVHSVGASISGELSEADTVFLPDGSNVCYHSDLLYDIFDPGQTLNNINHLLGVRMCLEHSYLGDISIRLTCPSGQTAILKEQFANVPPMPPGGVVSNACSAQGGPTNLGCAPDPASGQPCYLVPGIGWDYEFRPGATGCFGTSGATVGYNYTDQCGGVWNRNSLIPSIPNIYTSTPTNPVFYGSFQNLNALLGCPLNGNWRITICDHWGIDNGYIFNWALSLDQSIIPGGWEYNVDVDTVIWHGTGVTPTGSTSAIIDLGSAGVNVYSVTIIDEYGCQFDTTFTIEVVQSPEPNINDGLDTARICAGEMIILNANYEDPNAQYWWNTGATTDEIIAMVEGLYYIQITAMTQDQSLICTGSDSVYVSVNYHPLPDFDVDNRGGCAPVKLQFENLTEEE